MTTLSVLSFLVLAHGRLIHAARRVASAEQRIVRSDCQSSYRTATRRFRWSSIRQRFVKCLAILMGVPNLAQQLSQSEQVCRFLRPRASMRSSNKILRRMPSRPYCSAASHLVRAHRTLVLGCLYSRDVGRTKPVMLVNLPPFSRRDSFYGSILSLQLCLPNANFSLRSIDFFLRSLGSCICLTDSIINF